MILSKELTYSSVIEAMEKGDMYASTGPAIYEISMKNGIVHVASSPADEIILMMGGKSISVAFAQGTNDLTSVDLTLSDVAPYFRVAVLDDKGHIATSRGFFRDEFIM